MKLILLLLIINLLLNRKPTGYLYCGLFGWVGSNPSTFSRHAFTILGMANESRGGDSCGVYGNKGVTYGTGYSRDFPTFIKKAGKISAGKDCVVLGHTRKASVGAATAENAQPIVLKDNEGELGFVLTHNGTLTNHEELAKKYDLDISNLDTDSQILAALLYYTEAGQTVFEQYNGAAAVVFHVPGTKTIYIFKGKSKNASNIHYSSEERPLYGYQESDHSFYYSSLRAPLEIIAKNEEDIFDFKSNCLIKITAGKIEEIIPLDRSKRYQRFVEPYVYKKPVNQHVAGYNYGNYHDDEFDFSSSGRDFNRNHKHHNPLAERVTHHNPHKFIISEDFATMGDEMVNFTKGRYHLGENLVHHVVNVSPFGLVINVDKWQKDYYTLYFWEGILLYGKDQFEDLTALKADIKYISPKHMTLLEASPYPIASYDEDIVSKDFKMYHNSDVMLRPEPFRGRFVPIFCNKIYTFMDGALVTTANQSTLNKLDTEYIESLKTWA